MPDGSRPAYGENVDIQAVPRSERWSPDWSDDPGGPPEREAPLPEDEPEAPQVETLSADFTEAETPADLLFAPKPSALTNEPAFAEPTSEADPAELQPMPHEHALSIPAADAPEPPALTPYRIEDAGDGLNLEALLSKYDTERPPTQPHAAALSETKTPVVSVPDPKPVAARDEPEAAKIVVAAAALSERQPPPRITVSAPVATTIDPPAPTPAPPATPKVVAAVIPPPEPRIRIVLDEIETLGDSPEIGLLRQRLGARPDGLFGFSTMYPAALVALLKNRFSGTGALQNLVTKPAWGHHYIVDRRYDLSWKSEIKVGQMPEAVAVARESERLTRLREQLINNLTGNRRLFVYAGTATDDQIAAIRAAMGRYGRNTLLHLVIADAKNPAGRVAWREDGLLRGYLSRYGNKDGRWDIAQEDWVAVCLAAHGLWKAFPHT